MSAIFQQVRGENSLPIDLSIGSPHLPPSELYCSTLESVIRERNQSKVNAFGYRMGADLFGVSALIAKTLEDQYGVSFNASHVKMSVGATGALDAVLGTLLVEDQEVIVLTPCFIDYCSIIENNNGIPVPVETDETFGLSLSNIEKALTEKTAAIILNSPNNPTGRIYSEESLRALAALLKVHAEMYGSEVTVIEDAVYTTIVKPGTPVPSIMPRWNRVVQINSFSKILRIGGERLGYLAVHPDFYDSEDSMSTLLEALAVTIRHRVVHPSAIQQEVISRMGFSMEPDCDLYMENSERLAASLEDLGFEVTSPEGTFYLWAKLPEYIPSEEAFRSAAFSGDQPIIYMPGTLFGGDRFDRYVRFSVCVSAEKISEAVTVLRSIKDSFQCCVA